MKPATQMEQSLLSRVVANLEPDVAAIFSADGDHVYCSHGVEAADFEPKNGLISRVVETEAAVSETNLERSVLAVPYKDGEQILRGIMYLEFNSPRRLKHRDLAILQELRRRIEKKLWRSGRRKRPGVDLQKLMAAQKSAVSTLNIVTRVLKPERAVILVNVEGTPRLLASNGLEDKDSLLNSSVSRQLIDYLWQTGKPTFVADAETEFHEEAFADAVEFKIRSVAAAPLIGNDGVSRGIIYLDSRNVPGRFLAPQLSILSRFADSFRNEISWLIDSDEESEVEDELDTDELDSEESLEEDEASAVAEEPVEEEAAEELVEEESIEEKEPAEGGEEPEADSEMPKRGKVKLPPFARRTRSLTAPDEEESLDPAAEESEDDGSDVITVEVSVEEETVGSPEMALEAVPETTMEDEVQPPAEDPVAPQEEEQSEFSDAIATQTSELRQVPADATVEVEPEKAELLRRLIRESQEAQRAAEEASEENLEEPESEPEDIPESPLFEDVQGYSELSIPDEDEDSVADVEPIEAEEAALEVAEDEDPDVPVEAAELAHDLPVEETEAVDEEIAVAEPEVEDAESESDAPSDELEEQIEVSEETDLLTDAEPQPEHEEAPWEQKEFYSDSPAEEAQDDPEVLFVAEEGLEVEEVEFITEPQSEVLETPEAGEAEVEDSVDEPEVDQALLQIEELKEEEPEDEFSEEIDTEESTDEGEPAEAALLHPAEIEQDAEEAPLLEADDEEHAPEMEESAEVDTPDSEETADSEEEPAESPLLEAEEEEPTESSLLMAAGEETNEASLLQTGEEEPVEAPLLQVDEEEPVEAPLLQVDEEEPVEAPLLQVDEEEPVEVPLLQADDEEPDETPLLQVEEEEPTEAPLLQVDEEELVEAPLLQADEEEATEAPLLQVEEEEPTESSLLKAPEEESAEAPLLQADDEEPVEAPLLQVEEEEPAEAPALQVEEEEPTELSLLKAPDEEPTEAAAELEEAAEAEAPLLEVEEDPADTLLKAPEEELNEEVEEPEEPSEVPLLQAEEDPADSLLTAPEEEPVEEDNDFQEDLEQADEAEAEAQESSEETEEPSVEEQPEVEPAPEEAESTEAEVEQAAEEEAETKAPAEVDDSEQSETEEDQPEVIEIETPEEDSIEPEPSEEAQVDSGSEEERPQLTLVREPMGFDELPSPEPVEPKLDETAQIDLAQLSALANEDSPPEPTEEPVKEPEPSEESVSAPEETPAEPAPDPVASVPEPTPAPPQTEANKPSVSDDPHHVPVTDLVKSGTAVAATSLAISQATAPKPSFWQRLLGSIFPWMRKENSAIDNLTLLTVAGQVNYDTKPDSGKTQVAIHFPNEQMTVVIDLDPDQLEYVYHGCFSGDQPPAIRLTVTREGYLPVKLSNVKTVPDADGFRAELCEITLLPRK